MRMFNPEDHTEGNYGKSDEMKQLETPEEKKLTFRPVNEAIAIIPMEKIAKELHNINNELQALNKTLRRK